VFGFGERDLENGPGHKLGAGAFEGLTESRVEEIGNDALQEGDSKVAFGALRVSRLLG